jgi:hypothetical protein
MEKSSSTPRKDSTRLLGKLRCASVHFIIADQSSLTNTDETIILFLSGGRLRTGGWGQLILPTFWVNLVRNKRSGVKGNFEGDGR